MADVLNSPAATAPLDTSTPNTAQPIGTTAGGGIPGTMRPAGIPVDVRLIFEYDKIRNMILVVVAAIFGVSLLMLFLNYILDKK